MAIPIVSRWINSVQKHSVPAQCFVGCGGLAALTFLGVAFRVNLSTMSFVYLLLVVVVAVRFGLWPATLTSFVAVACLDYYFTPPIFTFNITDPQDYVELGAFELTALVISRCQRGRCVRRKKLQSIVQMEQLYELSGVALA